MSQLVLRLFDPMRDEHPVQWLLDKWHSDMCGPLTDWLEDVLQSPIPKPSEVIMPEKGGQMLMGSNYFTVISIVV